MATTIKLKNGSGAPLASDLVQGEVALDLTNKRIYTENSGGAVIELGTSPSTIDINAGTVDGISSLSTANGTDVSFAGVSATKFFWDASAESLGIGTSSPSAALDVVGEATVGNGTYGIKLSYSAGSTAGVIDTADSATNLSVRTGGTEAMRIDSSGNVGIGTATFDSNWAPRLQVSSSASDGTGGIVVESYRPSLIFKDASASAVRQHIVADDSSLIFGSGDASFTERMRIDSSGNLLVGTTDATQAANTSGSGIVLLSDGGLEVARDTYSVAYFNKTSTADGTIISLLKQGTTVGSIGVGDSDNLYITGGSGSTKGLIFTDDRIIAGANGYNFQDNNTDLGHPSYRFKDLYLSGGVLSGRTTRKSTNSVSSSVSVTHYIGTSLTEWQPFYISIKVASGRTGLQEQQAAWYLYKGQSFNGTISGVALVDSGGNSAEFSISITATTSGSIANVLIQATDAGADRLVIGTEIGAFANQLLS